MTTPPPIPLIDQGSLQQALSALRELGQVAQLRALNVVTDEYMEALIQEINDMTEQGDEACAAPEAKTEKTKPARAFLPNVPDVRHNGQITVLANLIVNGALEAFHSAQSHRAADWNKGERIPTFMHTKESGRVFFSLRPQGREPLDDGQLTEEELAMVTAQLTGSGGTPRITSLNGDVLLILLGHATSTPPDASGNRWITAEQILNYRGLQKVSKAVSGNERRTAGHRTEKIEEIGTALRQLNNTWVQLHNSNCG